MTDRTDDFNRADGGLGANWTAMSDAFLTTTAAISSNKATAPVNNDATSFWSADTFQNDQYAEAIHTSASGQNGCGPVCRATSVAGVDKCYEWNGGLGGFGGALYLFDSSTGGGWNTLALTAATASGDLIRLECTGTSIIGKVNGSTVTTQTDATLAGGCPGLHIFVNSGATGFLDDWLGGPITAAGDQLMGAMVM